MAAKISRVNQLRGLFDQLNRDYFRGELPEYEIEVTDLRRCSGGFYVVGDCNNNLRRIQIAPVVGRGEEERQVMLHEMVHISAKEGRIHGKEFRAELLRIASMGEYWAKDEASEYEMDEQIGDQFIYACKHLNWASWIFVRKFITEELGISASTLLRLRPDLPDEWRWARIFWRQ